MDAIKVVTDLRECRRVWHQVVPDRTVTDLWEFRDCFRRHFRRPAHFIVVERSGRILGLLPLSRIQESDSFGYFPGETWNGQTWLEQNRFFAADERVATMILDYLETSGMRYHLRYLLPFGNPAKLRPDVDEIGYLFHPPQYNFEMERYFAEFSHKSLKKILKEVSEIEGRGVSYRYDDPEDFDLMLHMNRNRYGAYSYFDDRRFAGSFHDLMQFLLAMGWLRMTTVLVDGRPAAVDMGCLYRGVYTLLAGGTDENVPGIAKLINLHQMRRACQEKMTTVDFLCGDFSWKSRFHLSPRPLYLLSNTVKQPALVPAEKFSSARAGREHNNPEQSPYAF